MQKLAKRILFPLFTVRQLPKVCFQQKFHLLKPRNQIHLNCQRNFKTFIDKENLHAYEIIKSSNILLENYKTESKVELNDDLNSILLNTNWKSLSPTDLTQKFVEIADHAAINNICISNKIFDSLIDEIIRKCRQLSDENVYELLKSLRKWPETESIKSNNFGDLWSALDDMCLERYKNWETDKLFKYAELWYKLNLSKVSEYMGECIDRIARKPNKLTSKQLVELMFYVNVLRRPLSNMIDFEYKIMQIMDELSVDEVAVICMAFFKTQTSIKDSRILAEIIQKVRNNADTIHEISLCAIMKTIRYSRHLNIVDQINCMLTDLVKQIDRVSLLSCIHIGLIGTISHLYHEEIITKIADKFFKNIQNARLKDIERIIFIMTLYNYRPKYIENFYGTIIQELRKRDPEIEKYPRCLISSVHYLSIMQLYPEDLIRRVLKPEFLSHTYGKAVIGREVFNLDTCLKIDIPDYDGDCLSDEKRLSLSKRYTKWPPVKGRSMPLTDKVMLEVIDSLTDLFNGNQYLEINHVLPHFERADIIFGLDRQTQKPIDVRNAFSIYKLSDIKNPPKMEKEVDWYAMVIGGWNHFIRGSNQPTGPIGMKIRQLEKIGYHSILVDYSEWRALLSPELKHKYLKNLIRHKCTNNFRLEIKNK